VAKAKAAAEGSLRRAAGAVRIAKAAWTSPSASPAASPTATGPIATSPMTWPPGHFYSPIPSLEDLGRCRSAAGPYPEALPGLDLDGEGQLQLLDELARYYDDQPFSAHETDGCRFYFENDFFSYGDALVFHCMLRHLSPARVIEIGSGFSSAVLLDTVDRFLPGGVECTFVEPYPTRLLGLLSPEDRSRVSILESFVQDVETARFDELDRGDILFVDSSHVSKAGSDVNHILFELLPRLRSGVFVHFHDIFHPFEYPESWLMEGRAWNEAYILRAFLSFNKDYKIRFFNSYMDRCHGEQIRARLPWSFEVRHSPRFL